MLKGYSIGFDDIVIEFYRIYLLFLFHCSLLPAPCSLLPAP
ncbi:MULTISPECIES: hypothetical protein [unclassified Moorena]|nr:MULTISPECIES: hypothetical protein [unclassified Moorena]